jgi:hypothetical protein
MQSNAWARVRAFSAVAVVAAFAVAPAGAADDTVQDELKQMRELVLQLQDQVQSQSAQIEDQGTVIRDAGLADTSSSSRLSSFLESTDFSGSAAASYFYNTNNPIGGAGGNGPIANPFHPDSNSIQVDQIWLSMSRTATADSPVGFGIDIVYGAVAAGGIGEDNSSNAFWLNQAYIDYMIGGVTIQAGKFGTHIGYETANQAENINITRAFSYNLLQPFSQIGVRASTSVAGLDVMFGVTNGYGEGQPEYEDGNNKDIVWSLGWSNDSLGASFNGEWGERPGNGDNSALTLNGVVTFDPSDSITTWADITWRRIEIGPTDVFEPGNPLAIGVAEGEAEAVAIALGGRVALNDKMGVAARFEWGRFDGGLLPSANSDFPGFVVIDNGLVSENDTDVWAITGTFDYLLAQGLTMKAEIAYSQADADGPGPGSNIFRKEKNGFSDDQVLLGLQLVYAF